MYGTHISITLALEEGTKISSRAPLATTASSNSRVSLGYVILTQTNKILELPMRPSGGDQA